MEQIDQALSTSSSSKYECIKDQEAAELIKILRDAFNVEGDMDCLENAIKLATDLAPSDRNVVPLLNHLLELQAAGPECAKKIQSKTAVEPENNQQDSTPSPSSADHPVTTQAKDTLELHKFAPRKHTEAHTLDNQPHPADNSSRLPLAGDPPGNNSQFSKIEGLGPVFGPIGEASGTTPLFNSDQVPPVIFPRIGPGEAYEQYKVPNDLGQPVERAEKAIAETSTDNSHRESRLGSFDGDIAPKPNHEHEELPADLVCAIRYSQEAVTATPADHPDRAMRLNNLGLQYLRKYERFRASEDLEQAIKLIKEAVAAAPINLPERFNLGRVIQIGCTESGVPQDIDQMIKWTKEAVEALPAGHPEWVAWAGSLGGMFGNKFAHSGAPNDLSQSIDWTEQAVAALPLYDPLRPSILCTLIWILTSGNGPKNYTEEFHRIMPIYYEVWHCPTASPTTRIRAARAAVSLLLVKKRWQDANVLLEAITKMLPKLSSRSDYLLSNCAQIAADTFSAALQAGEDAAHSLRLLEFGQRTSMSLMISSRGSSSELQLNHPEIFDTFNHLRDELGSPPLSTKGQEGSSSLEPGDRRAQVTQELEKTLISIRKLPGFEGFQLPPRSDDLMEMAINGPIVIFNSTSLRSDAVIVTDNDIKSHQLPSFSYTEVQKWMSEMPRLVHGKRSTYASRNKKMESFLIWLWDVAVEPILRELQMDAVTDPSNLPRIWWIGVGLLAAVPFHAAGDHSHGSTRNTLCRAISSYTPTIEALSNARRKKLELFGGTGCNLLLVTMPKTPGEGYLEGAPEDEMPKACGGGSLGNKPGEVDRIAKIVEETVETTRLDSPSTDQVLAELPSHRVIHFTCLSLSDPGSPSDSYISLQKDDGSQSVTVDKLTVGMISNTDIRNAQIAYLSASGPAQNTYLIDEPITIASGFQLAGFSHVLATQWFSEGGACLQVAADFYSHLFKGKAKAGSKSGENHRIVSASYHRAVEKLRDANRRQPIKWVPFIHTGA